MARQVGVTLEEYSAVTHHANETGLVILCNSCGSLIIWQIVLLWIRNGQDGNSVFRFVKRSCVLKSILRRWREINGHHNVKGLGSRIVTSTTACHFRMIMLLPQVMAKMDPERAREGERHEARETCGTSNS